MIVPMKILFVCLGNICRSPAAEAIFRSLADDRATGVSFIVDSAGCAGYHIGKAPDGRMVRAAARRGIDMSTLRARQVGFQDYQQFDWLVAMDTHNFADLQAWQPAVSKARLCLLMDYPQSPMLEVPDPYYGRGDGFERVLDLLYLGCEQLLNRLEADVQQVTD